jgi:lipoprotein-anchoring transpeptidase ErfK/SrfK
MHRIRQAALAVTATALAAGALATTASASPTTSSSPTTPTATTPTTPTTTPTTAPAAAGKATLSLPGIFVVSKKAVTVPGRVVSVTGDVRPYVAGQTVTVRSFLGRRQIKHDVLRIKPAGHGRYGTFTEKVKSSGAGIVKVEIQHAATSTQQAFTAERRFAALSESVHPGSSGPFVQLLQQRLAALHIYLLQSGVFDSFTGLALDAYHRLLGQGEGNQSADPATVNDLLNGAGSFQVKYPGQGFHVEGDLTHQVLAIINGSKVVYLFPISSGKPSTPTILGNYQIYERTPGYLPDGMYYSDFFIRGYAIHGYDPAPDYPASHGCMRLPIQDAIFVYNQLKIGDWVDTYYR